MKRAFFPLLVIAGIFNTAICQAEVTSSHVEYHDGGTILQGTVVKDSVGPTTRPVVVVFHDWMGPSEVTTASAEQIAKLGYIAFIADVYGKGIRPTTVPEASAQSTIYKSDRTLMRHRAELALSAASEIPGVDSKKVAAIGYCFGGTVALELARDGAKLNGVVSLHGGLETPDTSIAKNITTKLLVLHGADDPFVPAKEVNAFVEEMQKAKVDFNLIKYPGAVHAFTNKKADDLKLAGAKYNAEADTKSFSDMSTFLAKVFS